MADLNGINGLGLPTDAAGSGNGVAKKNTNLGQEDFMKLLIAQMSYQNPLEPQENGEFIAQMAQFGTVDGIQNLEKSFESLNQTLQSNQALQASTLVGRKVEVKADQMELQAGQSVEGSVQIETPVQNLSVTILGANGEKINSVKIGNASPGFVEFTLPGTDVNGNPIAAGDYRIVAEAQVGSSTVAQPTYLAANVDSVTLGQAGGDVTLTLAGLGTAKMSDIREIS